MSILREEKDFSSFNLDLSKITQKSNFFQTENDFTLISNQVEKISPLKKKSIFNENFHEIYNLDFNCLKDNKNLSNFIINEKYFAKQSNYEKNKKISIKKNKNLRHNNFKTNKISQKDKLQEKKEEIF